MENRDFAESLLNEKIKRFKSAVAEAAERLGTKQPKVKIWECPDSGSEIAHCHYKEHMICISERMLKLRTFDELVETATHEVSHLIHHNHSDEFHITHQDLMKSSWKPPTGVGVVAYSEENLKNSFKKRSPPKEDKKDCNYYQANEHVHGKLIQCIHCQRYFCSKHASPRPASVKWYKHNKFSMEAGKYDEDNTHPCIEFSKFMEDENEKRQERYGEALDKILRNKKNLIDKNYENYEETIIHPGIKEKERNRHSMEAAWKKQDIEIKEMELEERERKSFAERKAWLKEFKEEESRKDAKIKEGRKKRMRKVLPIVIALIIILTTLFLWKLIGTSGPNINTNNTVVMSQKELDQISEKSLEKINEYRMNNSVPMIKEDNSLHTFAFYLAKEKSFGKNYFTSLEREDLISKFKVSPNVVFFGGDISDSSDLQINYMLSRWQNIESTKENLLNSSLRFGSVACYSTNCYFVAAEKTSASNTQQNPSNSLNNIIDKIKSYLASLLSAPANLPDTTSNLNLPDSSSSVFGDFVNGIFDPKSQIDISKLEQEVHNMINSNRANNGLRPLIWDDKIASIAREHSQDMVINNFFSHDSPNGDGPTERGSRAGYSCRNDYGTYYTYGLGENIALTPIYSDVIGCGSTTDLESLAKCIVDGWMNSPGHRQNILSRDYTKAGVGIAYSSDNKAYSTQDFC